MKFTTLHKFFLTLTVFASIALQPFVCASTSSAKTSSKTLDEYFEYLDKYPETLGPMGNASLGEIEIIRDRKKIAEIEKSTGRTVGMIAKDKYWMWVNDAVQFPNKQYGVYGRLFWISSLTGSAGVAVMPILPNGKIALNRNYRHATRSWEYELPRGKRDHNETIEQTAIREVKEETGFTLKELHVLGEMTTDSGMSNNLIPVFLAKVASQDDAAPEAGEAIAGIDAFSVEELYQGLIDGYLIATIEGKKCQIKLRDSFLTFALLQAELRSLLPKKV
ncbi:MAG TPA: NUDIX domain-containing protein [Rhabdochlamydiaceae bacterium]|jgi:ADP-ribose pyrophosphatase